MFWCQNSVCISDTDVLSNDKLKLVMLLRLHLPKKIAMLLCFFFILTDTSIAKNVYASVELHFNCHKVPKKAFHMKLAIVLDAECAFQCSAVLN